MKVATIESESGPLGQVYLEDGVAVVEEAVGPLIDSVYTGDLTVEDGEAFIDALPLAFANNSRVWVTLSDDLQASGNPGFVETAVQPGNVERVDRFATMTAACPPSERELREPFEGGMSVVAPIVEEYGEKHLGKLKDSTVRQPVALPQEWKPGMTASGYQSEQETRRDFLASLTAASLKEQESETQSEDNARYADELCPDCGQALQGDGMCASCGYDSMAAAAPKIQIGKPAVHKEGIGTAVTYTERNGKKVLTEEERKQLEHDKKRALRAGALVAAGIAPVHPPREWFEAEEPDGPMPLTITADGQVMGHVATWGSCHTGFPGRCTQPPPSPSGYSYFHTGALELGDGSTIPVGRLTFNTGHASLTASRSQAAAHYDHTGKVGAFVRATDGKYGIWVTGATRSDLEEPEIQSLRASAPSGDWRRPAPGKPMEMVGLLSVNVAGFPVPRGEALVAGAEARDDEEVLAMVAAGFEETVAMADAYYAKRLEVLALIAAGTLEESLMTPMERVMAGTPAAR